MPLLITDVALDSFPRARADGERAVAFLPLKDGKLKFFVNPLRGFAFQHPHEVGQTVGWFQSDEAVNVIRNPTDGQRRAFQSFDATTEPFVEARFPRSFDEVSAILDGPDEVIMKAGVGGGHGTMFMRPYRGAGCFCRMIRWVRPLTWSSHRLPSFGPPGRRVVGDI